MQIIFTERKLNKHVKENQATFNLMVEAAHKLANNFLKHGFDLYKTNALPDTTMANEWFVFINSNFYQLYNTLILPISITDTRFPGAAFKLFTGCFKVDRETRETTFLQERLIEYVNYELGRRVKDLAFNYTSENKQHDLPERSENAMVNNTDLVMNEASVPGQESESESLAHTAANHVDFELVQDNPEKERDIRYIKENQETFNLMITAGNELANKWLQSGFTPFKNSGFRDARMADEWYPFINSRFYHLYNALLLPVSINDARYPGKAFNLFSNCFDMDLNTNEVSFNQDILILFFNEEIGRRHKWIEFKYTSALKKQELHEEVEEMVTDHQSDDTQMNEQELNQADNTLHEEESPEIVESSCHTEFNERTETECSAELFKKEPNEVPEYSEQGEERITETNYQQLTPTICLPEIDQNSAIISTVEENNLAQPEFASACKPKATETNTSCFNGISMSILSGFIIGVGAAAVALAFTVLNAATFGLAGIIAASLGTAALLGGLGIFSYSAVNLCKTKNNEHDEEAAYSSLP